MSFFRNASSLWTSLRNRTPRSPARGRTAIPQVEPLEVRTLLAGEFTEELVPGGFITRTQIDVSELDAATHSVTDPGAELNGNGLQFNLIAAQGMPQQAIDGFQAAANLWSAVLRDDIIVNVNINFTQLAPQVLGETSAVFQTNSFTSVKTALTNDAKSLSDATAVANLPAGPALTMSISNSAGAAVLDNNNTVNNTTLNLTRANAKALGLTAANSTASDGSLSFSSDFAFDFDRSDGITANTIDFVGVAVHEIGHLLGFDSGASTVDFLTGLGTGPRPNLDLFPFVQPLDLFRFSAVSEAAGMNIDVRADTDVKYFSIDGGTTQLTTYATGSFNGDGKQASHWKDDLNIGLMDPSVSYEEFADVTNLDVQAFDVIGWDVAMDLGDAPDAAAGTATGNYATNLSDNGPRHLLFSASGNTNDPTGAPKVYLGAGVTGELAALQNSTATGDSDNGVPSIPALTTGSTQTFTVNSTGNGAKLNYFVDFNRDGDFADAGESFSTTLTSTSQTVSVAVPANASVGTTFARFRISTAGGLSSVGPANDGEAEDYQVTVASAPFTNLGALGLTGVHTSSVAWGDSDNDGDLDILLTGSDSTIASIAKVYRNDGNNTFTDVNAGLAGVWIGSVAWGDSDNDGDLDILLTGRDSTNASIAKVYRNNGNNLFTDVNAGLTGVSSSSVAWGDSDNDGDLDILLTGQDSLGAHIAKVYRNNGNNLFTDVNAGLTGVSSSSVAWGDSDNDGDLDILVTGSGSSGDIAKVYRNDGNNTFTDVNAGLAGVTNGSVAWGDSDNDGDLDILLTGRDSTNARIAKVYRNDGNYTFTDVNAGLVGVNVGSVAWGDSDNDGDLDILLTGYAGSSSRIAKVYRNDGNNTFTDVNAGLAGVTNGSVAWGDSDNDGDLDILLTGQDSTGTNIARVYRNNATTPNTAPNTPTGLGSTVASSDTIAFYWTSPADSQTPANGLSYNLRVGTTPGGSDVFSTMASTVTGVRRLATRGPIQGTVFLLSGLDSSTTYYWSVQAIDTALAGGAFAPEQTARFPFTASGNVGITFGSRGDVAWGDYDNDGDLDALVTGFSPYSVMLAQVYRNDGNNTFTDINAGLTGVTASSVAWGDMDKDGDLDILLTGYSSSGRVSKVYRNNGNSTFTDINAGLTAVDQSSVAWGDYDNDGDLDIALTGKDDTYARVSKVYRNNGNSTFTEINAGLPGVYQSSVAWGDYDNDRRLDLLVAGATSDLDDPSGYNPITKVYRNTGSGFVDSGFSLIGVRRGAVAWGDSDNDGKLDILVTGMDNDAEPLSAVYRNTSSGFVGSTAGLFDVYAGDAAWGDYDNDGKLDILLTGSSPSSTYFSQVFRNTGNNAFEPVGAGLIEVNNGSANWADINNDGKLDIVLTGIKNGFFAETRIYTNNSSTANSAPNTPTNLRTFTSPTAITFAWSAPTDGQTPSTGLSYNLRVGTTPGGSDVFSTMSDTDANAGNGPNGRRRLPSSGPIQRTSWTLNNLTPNVRYYWSVQAVDTAFGGSAFAAEQSTVTNTVPSIGGAVSNQTMNDDATKAVFSTLTVTDPDTNAMSATVAILNGVVRGDFSAGTAGWTRTVVGNDIRYSRTYPSAANIGATVQAALRGFVFQPRMNAIKPNKTEATAFTVTVSDGVATPVSNSTTTVITTSVNNTPAIGGANLNVVVNDNATVNPLSTLTVSEVDLQEMLISVTILNGTVRGDFTPASTAGWTVRYVLGNNITYKRYFGPQANVGAAAQAAFRALVFQPRQNAITPGTTEVTDFQVTVSDGVAPAVLGAPNTRVTTTSVNNAPTIGGAVAGQTLNDNQTKAVFSTLTVTDPDTQSMNVIITIPNGVNRGDFTAGSTAGWTRTVVGGDLRYNRFFNATANIGATVQTAIRALVFQPRTNVPIGTTETTGFTVFLNDGLANTTNSTTTVITTGVAPRSAASTVAAAPLFLDSDIKTVIVPTVTKPKSNPLARLLKRAR